MIIVADASVLVAQLLRRDGYSLPTRTLPNRYPEAIP